jgi:HEAT repeat protein
MRKLLPLAALFLCMSALQAQDREWNSAREEARKAKKNPDPAVRSAAVDKLAGYDNKESVGLLLDFWAVSTILIQQNLLEKIQKLEEMDAMPIKKKLQSGKMTLTQDEMQQKEKFEAMSGRVKKLEQRISRDRAIQRMIRGALGKMKEGESVKVLRGKLRTGKDWSIRAAAAEALGDMEATETADEIQKMLKSEKDPRTVVAFMNALGKMMTGAEAIAKRLDKAKTWQVKIAATDALRRIGDPKGIEALINALATVDGRIRDDMNKALVQMTGVNKHGDHATWKAWWEENKERLIGGSYKRPEKAAEGGGGKKTTFYGIPVVSKRLVFILDRSGSMAEPAGWKPKDEGTASGPGADKGPKEEVGDRKIDVAKYELKRAVRALPEDAMFNVLFYNQNYSIWLDSGLGRADAAGKKAAIEFIDSLTPEGATNIFDPTEKSFMIRDANDPRFKKDPGMSQFKGGVDTIYLLSDGVPNNGRITDPDQILAKVREMNADRKIIIHTVAVGSTSNPGFMKSLADQNGGEFVHRK